MEQKAEKQKLLNELYAPFQNCTQCPLGTLGRTHIVWGEGDPNAQLMFIGEAPGADEDAQGRPFVGRSGKLLTKTIEGLGIKREDVFIANIVKCRPPENRAPRLLESSVCMTLFLFNQIKIVQPKIICTLGNSPLQALLGSEMKITKVRGTVLEWQGFKLVPAYHPAYILRNPPALKTFTADLAFVIEMLGQK